MVRLRPLVDFGVGVDRDLSAARRHNRSENGERDLFWGLGSDQLTSRSDDGIDATGGFPGCDQRLLEHLGLARTGDKEGLSGVKREGQAKTLQVTPSLCRDDDEATIEGR